MLDVDEAPKIPATKPMTYDELYVEPLTDPIPLPAAGALEVAKYWKSSHSYPILRFTTSLLLIVTGTYMQYLLNTRLTLCLHVAANGAAGSSSPPMRASPAPQVPNGAPPPVPQTSESRDLEPNFKAAAPIAPVNTDNRNIVRRKLTGYVGFANLPNQWHRKSVRKGFNFNVMVVGE